MQPPLFLSRYRTQLSVAVVVLLAALGFVALYHLLREVHSHDIRAAFHALGPTALLPAIALTIISYVTLTFYDVLALRAIGRPLPYGTAAIASFTSYTLSHNLGLALLTGGSARYRIYSAAGLGMADVARVVALASATFWGGVFTLVGVTLAWRPQMLAIDGIALSTGALRLSGIAILAAMAGLMLYAGRHGRMLRAGGMSLPLPSASRILGQIGIGTIDLAAASAALFVLVPGLGLHDWPSFFLGYTLAIVAVLITHVPGGVGIFEAVMIAALPGIDKPQLVAALLAYRLIYYILPLIVAVAIIVAQESRRWRRPMGRTLRGIRTVTTGLAPLMTAALVFLGGAILLISGSLPAIPHRVATLNSVVPLPFLEISHLAGSLVGAALLILSAGLYRRLDGAFWLTRALLLAGALFSLLKGLDYEEALAMLAIAALLQWARPAFYRRTQLLAEAFSPGWLATVAVVIGLSFWLGFFAYKHVEYQNDLWWRFAERGDASRFLRASFGVALLLVTLSLWRLLRPARQVHPAASQAGAPPDTALALAHRTDVNLAFTGDKRFLVSDDEQCFLMYQIKGHSWIVMGDPVGARTQWGDLLWRLREEADAAQGRLLLYQISQDMLPLTIELGLQIVKYGEEAHVDLAGFTLEGPDAKPLRYAERRATRDGASFDIIPAAALAPEMERLADISNHWLHAKGHREKCFSVGRFDPDYMARFDCAVVRRDGRIVAFANIWASADRSELSVDLMRHDDDAPYGAMDFLFVHLMQWGRDQGYGWFNLGLAPLSGLEARRLAPLWSKLGALLYQHGNALYGFEGLRAYKEKFTPQWDARFVAGPQGISLGRALLDLQGLIAG